ncbi:hypothetical protein GS501_00645 [Saccharibacter sp. 17.LH.SD]|uniref:hypothetical protein n=1 Tax=Saccharibacter sp. 17.LH.SD TaxID=2689393 RepID=UPI00139FF07F|nr:hypothetical protein [Saccharibacter sp. 17.LH.SD]MXV43587.1 hypothetical protein [Saccharibacter sp. 17.LH.SD]
MSDLNNPADLPLAKAGRPLNRLLGTQTDEHGETSYYLFPLDTSDDDVGPPGPPGDPGKDAYQLAVQQGFQGSEQDWLKSLVGPKGDRGDPGENAYEVAVQQGFQGTKADWLKSLVGPQGDPGPSGAGQVIDVPLAPGWNTQGHTNDGDVAKGSLNYAGGITTALGVGDNYGQGPSWSYIHLKPAQQASNPQANPDLYLTFTQHGELGYTTENNGSLQYHYVSSPSDIYHDTPITKTGVRSQQNRRDQLYLTDTNGTFHGVTENAISGQFGCNTAQGQKPFYSLFLSADGTEALYAAEADPNSFDPSNPLLSWGALTTTKGVLQGTAGFGRKQWDTRVGNDGETMTIYNDIGPAGAFADTKITIDAYPIDAGLVGRLQPVLCLPIANEDGTCTSFTFHGAAGAFYRFVATGRLAS